MKLTFKYTRQEPSGQEIEFTVQATYFPGFMAPYPEPDEPAGIFIDSVTAWGQEVEVDDETLIAMERRAWEEYEGIQALQEDRIS